MDQYVVTSLETHLFFGRIMKEHALFLLAAFPAKELNYRRWADWYREQFERALEMAVQLANGRVGGCVLESGEIVTEYTEMAERQTSRLTGIPIRIQITRAQERLHSGCMEFQDQRVVRQVRNLNQRTLWLLNGLIEFKEMILKDVLSCNLYTANYPLLIEHILREAKWYQQKISDIENGCTFSRDKREIEDFWNQIMMEHAEFIRGLLDPTECELMRLADGFAGEYCCLLQAAIEKDCEVQEEMSADMQKMSVNTRELTKKYRDFKAAGTKGILECNVRSVILPLLADHVLREANHYLRILGNLECEK
ncbi:MAG: DUF2935 domain-containing protein [Ruminococcus sp.]|nr:DUF2935 domain-containing protein [Ruminococcus sp.]